jgi:hypothetical protein
MSYMIELSVGELSPVDIFVSEGGFHHYHTICVLTNEYMCDSVRVCASLWYNYGNGWECISTYGSI